MQRDDKLLRLRERMAAHKIDAYIVPSDDFHQSEYVSDYFKSREYISGFTGSAGTAVITRNFAGLWTDGRYFIQAEKELTGSEIKLFRAGEKGVPGISEFLKGTFESGFILGFDGRTISAEDGISYEKLIREENGGIVYEHDLIGEIWQDRPALPHGTGFHLDERYSGESTKSKLARIRDYMQSKNADMHIISSLEEIGWIFNMRGRDVDYTPVMLAYALIKSDSVVLFVDYGKLSPETLKNLKENEVEIREYNDIYSDLKCIPGGTSLLLSTNNINYSLYRAIPRDVKKIFAQDPAIMMKAIKNRVEIENIKKAYEMDGLASFKLMYLLKENFKDTAMQSVITEMDAAHKIETFRRENSSFVDDSFASISAYGRNAAMMHYQANECSNSELKEGNLYLIDSGGHYLEGTTDVTRTYSIGEISEEKKIHYTLVLKGMLRLSAATFMHGCRGSNLDILARTPIWEAGLDYRSGTGHGVGYLMSVHEGPARIKWQQNGQNPDADNAVLEAGMALTNEPGIYIEDSHGIRIENQLIIREKEENEWGKFLEFETVTVAPIDLDPLIPKLLTEEEKSFLNAYHAEVYKKLAPKLDGQMLEALKHYTREI